MERRTEGQNGVIENSQIWSNTIHFTKFCTISPNSLERILHRFDPSLEMRLAYGILSILLCHYMICMTDMKESLKLFLNNKGTTFDSIV